MNGNTLTLPQRPAGDRDFNKGGPRKDRDWKGGSHKDRPKPPAGHQIDLGKMKGKCTIHISLMSVEEVISGRLKDSDRYTVTVVPAGATQPVVYFKHAIMCYSFTPDAEIIND